MKKNPVVANSTSIESGRKIYIASCSPCHGEKGKGNGMLSLSLNPRPADHTNKKFQQQKDGEIFYKITTGRNSMPPFKQVFSENRIWNIVNFIRTLEVKTSPASVLSTGKSHSTPSPVVSQTTSQPISKKELNDTAIISKTKSLTDANDSTAVSQDSSLQTTISLVKDSDTALTSENKNPNSTAIIEDSLDGIFPVNQNENERRKFLVSGSAHTNVIIEGSKFNSAGFEAGLLPVFLWKPGKNLFFESHFHITVGAGKESTNTSAVVAPGTASPAPLHTHGGSSSTSTNASSDAAQQSPSIMFHLAYANLVYFIHPNISLTAGMFLSPFGIFAERLHPEWINKLPDAPLGMGHTDQMLPETELGIQLRGGLPVKNLRFNYALYVSNGPSLINSGANAGQISYENIIDNNSNKAVGGRVGILPFANSSLELGLSMQASKVGKTGTSYAGVDAQLYAADFSFGKNIKLLKGNAELKAQYNFISLDRVYYKADPLLTLSVPAVDVNLNDSTYRFNNQSELYFISLAYRPVASEKFWKNTEYILRYDVMNLPCYALWENDRIRWTAGLMYWIDSRSGIKLSYSYESSEKYLIIQWVMGL